MLHISFAGDALVAVPPGQSVLVSIITAGGFDQVCIADNPIFSGSMLPPTSPADASSIAANAPGSLPVEVICVPPGSVPPPAPEISPPLINEAQVVTVLGPVGVLHSVSLNCYDSGQ